MKIQITRCDKCAEDIDTNEDGGHAGKVSWYYQPYDSYDGLGKATTTKGIDLCGVCRWEVWKYLSGEQREGSEK